MLVLAAGDLLGLASLPRGEDADMLAPWVGPFVYGCFLTLGLSFAAVS